MKFSRIGHLVCLAIAIGLAGCGGSDDDVAPTPVAVADPCPALPSPAAPAASSVTGAYLCAAGVGVTNLEASVAFYKALGMTEKARLARTDRNEVVLGSADARGSHLVLFTHTDGVARNYKQNPGKIVFYVKDATAFGASLAAAGGTLSSPPVAYQGRQVGFGRDLDNNLVEIASSPDAVHSYLSAVGVGVSQLEDAKTFYTTALDLRVLVKLSVTKPVASGGTTPWYDEYILQSPTGKGSAVVLMTYTDGSTKNYTNNPVALGLRVDDPAAYMQRVAAAGKPVVRAPAEATEPVLGKAVYGTAKDADGTVLDVFAR